MKLKPDTSFVRFDFEASQNAKPAKSVHHLQAGVDKFIHGCSRPTIFFFAFLSMKKMVENSGYHWTVDNSLIFPSANCLAITIILLNLFSKIKYLFIFYFWHISTPSNQIENSLIFA